MESTHVEIVSLIERMEQMRCEMRELKIMLLDETATIQDKQTEIADQGSVLIEELAEVRADNAALLAGIMAIQRKLGIGVVVRQPAINPNH